ncbi:MAG: hypothetical protein KME06_14555 [Kastovskya adunca ATA6-11-RM4]|nr:hypothetical protein [Kastovskya adunca ATA6-11-RM4]
MHCSRLEFGNIEALDSQPRSPTSSRSWESEQTPDLWHDLHAESEIFQKRSLLELNLLDSTPILIQLCQKLFSFEDLSDRVF